MASLIFFVVLITALFAFSFFTKRRFGVLGLALAAGALLSEHWSATLTPFIENQGFVLVAPPLSTVVQTALILLPPLLLFMSGPSYEGLRWRLLGSVAFTLLAFTFLLQPIGVAVSLEGMGLEVYSFFAKYQSLLIVGGIIGAIVDVLLTRKPKAKGK
jgi:hypothetical protein